MDATTESAVLGAAVEGSEELAEIVTAYSDMKVPVLTIIMVALCGLLLIAAAAAGIVYVLRHFKGWGNGVLNGVLAQLLFCFLLCTAIQLGLSKIPALTNLETEQPALYSLMSYALTILLTFAGLLAGMYYAIFSAERRGMKLNVGAALVFGLAFYLADTLEGGYLSFPLQYGMIAVTVNQMGFDPAVSSFVANGTEEETAIQSLLELVQLDWFDYLCQYLSIFCSSVVGICAAVVIYGTAQKRLSKKWIAYAFLGYLAFWIPGILCIWIELPALAVLILMLVITGVILTLMQQLLVTAMPEEWKAMTAKGVPVFSGTKKKKEPEKMPKIKMPD